ncbi:TetR family transcriptional regulator [Neoasaia chiangmaiensis NBRC 101099]|uniref:Transcriptional regulator n=1 Tax=Neoasaia chiangmaiensis TaxID=320497 RepID=A0A1U9KUG0_9PROT|nr:TetR/AcrR family transcriptional regulator [Neoasaia chiangmaiensis]AQS89425.1 transcriptional regulator [Neoasaia chiangmaiensis]GBR40006.1 TetR family transcriptional regulator [Neoasaia chiangmaiensis NBRC 101099]GEN14841.1 TetR family transcriptional regulator [Neoasaia chiangmaiensis]
MVSIGRPRAFDREAALQAAMLVFWRKGFASASMTDLCDAMGIRSPSLYAAFGSKEALYLEAARRYADTVGAAVWDCLLNGDSARAGIESLLIAAAKNLPECGEMPAGCMVALATVGEACPDAIISTMKAIRADCLARLQSRLSDAVESGELPISTDTVRWSRFYMGIYLGMSIQARDGAHFADLAGIAEAAMGAWPGACGDETTV